VVVKTVFDFQSVRVVVSMEKPGGVVVMVSVIGGSSMLNKQFGNGMLSQMSGSSMPFRHPGNGLQLVGIGVGKMQSGNFSSGHIKAWIANGISVNKQSGNFKQFVGTLLVVDDGELGIVRLGAGVGGGGAAVKGLGIDGWLVGPP
jgi:hypothetical protein